MNNIIFYSTKNQRPATASDTRVEIGDLFRQTDQTGNPEIWKSSTTINPRTRRPTTVTGWAGDTSATVPPANINGQAPSLTIQSNISNVSTTAGVATNSTIAIVYGGGTWLGANGSDTYRVALKVNSVSPALPNGMLITAVNNGPVIVVDVDGISIKVNSTTLSVTGVAELGTELNNQSFAATVQDFTGRTTNVLFNLTIDPGIKSLSAVTQIETKTLTQNVAATPFLPVLASGGEPSLIYSISPTLPTGLTFNTNTGIISGTPSVVVSDQSYTIKVTDNLLSTVSKTFSLSVTPVPLIVNRLTAAYTFTQSINISSISLATSTGGVGIKTFEITPAVPAGLTFNTTTGVLTGTPTFSSTKTIYTVTVTDSNAPTTSAQSLPIEITVDALIPINTTVLNSSIELIKNTAENKTPVIATGGYKILTYSISPSLPQGLSLNSANGKILGSPTQTTAQTLYTITVTDEAGQTSSKAFNLTILPAVLTKSLTVSNIVSTQNVALSSVRPVTGGGGEPPLTYAVSPTLPFGLTLDTATGFISGTPTEISQQTAYTITITDSANQTLTEIFNLRVNAPPVLTATSNPTPPAFSSITKNESFTAFRPVTATGGFGTLTYTISPSLPTGLSFSTTGLVNGIASVNSVSTTYTVTITDQAAQTASSQFLLRVINSELKLSQTQTAFSLIRTIPISVPLVPVTASGGSGVYTYEVFQTNNVSNGLSTGLTLTEAGQIAGTSNSVVTQTEFTIKVTDSEQQTATKTFTLTVADPPVLAISLVNNVSSFTLTRGSSNSITPVKVVSGSQGYGTIKFTISPELPNGLTFNTSTGVISGNPTTLSSTTYTITAIDSFTTPQSSVVSFTISTVDPQLVLTINRPTVTLQRNNTVTNTSPVASSIGGLSPRTLSISPALPTGLIFDNGVILGTPTQSLALTEFTITLEDSFSRVETGIFNLAVEIPTPLTLAKTSNIISLTVGVSTNVTPVVASQGEGTYVYSAIGLPSGLTINSATGAITGKATANSGTYTVTVSVSDLVTTETINFDIELIYINITLTVNSASIFLVQYTTVNSTEPAAKPISATGGAGVLTYSISPSLPDALIYTSSGNITGTPLDLSPTTTYTVTVTDESNKVETATFDLIVVDTQPQPLEVVNDNSNFELTPNQPISFQPVVLTGGVGTITYRIEPTTLPEGLTFDPVTGIISGTIAADAAFPADSYTVFATDSTSNTISGNVSLTPFEATGTSGRGPRGYTGSQGVIGYTGSQGTQGYTGSQGSIGYTGSRGYTGSQGTNGFVGSRGYTGSQGANGTIGYTGSLGYTGSQGDVGYIGSQGDIGYTGSQGIPGEFAAIGYTGSKGDTGSGSTVTVGTINQANTIANTFSSIDSIRFDTDSGFTVADLGLGSVRVGMNSVFNTIKVNGQGDLVAVGLDTIELIAGNNIILETNVSSNPKSVTISSTASGTGSSGNLDGGVPNSNYGGITSIDAGGVS